MDSAGTMKRARMLLTALLLTAPGLAGAQDGTGGWQTVFRSPTDDAAARDTAVVVNETGDSVTIYRAEGDVVRGIFKPGNELAQLEEGSCPTIRIDRLPPHALIHLGGPCELSNPEVHFTLGVIENGRLQSTVLWQLMNGSGFRIWYHVKDRGYREAEFSLKRSMNALVGAIGPEVEVRP